MFSLLMDSQICASLPLVAIAILTIAFLIYEQQALRSDDQQDETGHR